MKRILTCTGIRPDFIRMSEIFKKLDTEFDHILVHTGQHYDANLSDVFFDDLDIRKPDHNLSIGAPGKSHYEQVADLSVKLTKLCTELSPDLVIFLGDSNSVLASIPLKKEGFAIAHIEAGMRSYDTRMLEEINRVACDHVSDMLFVYHENYKYKAIKENIAEESIHVVGNTIVEPLMKIADLNYRPTPQHIILDIHRPENFRYHGRMHNIIYSANKLSDDFNLPIKMLAFPRTVQSISKFNIDLGSIQVVPLKGYREYVRFQQESLFVYSDSGSAQEEPSLLGKPVIVPRDYTERPESYEANCSKRIDVDSDSMDLGIEETINWLRTHESAFCGNTSWLGDGSASQKIIDIIKEGLL
jgi:UDP-N-acetylglucosamine 2-epimerase (non-hydrolysing)